MTDSHYAVFTCTVRWPKHGDGFREVYGCYYTEDDEEVYAVLDLGHGRVLPYLAQYVDFYGDGGLQPDEVASDFFYRALGGK